MWRINGPSYVRNCHHGSTPWQILLSQCAQNRKTTSMNWAQRAVHCLTSRPRRAVEAAIASKIPNASKTCGANRPAIQMRLQLSLKKLANGVATFKKLRRFSTAFHGPLLICGHQQSRKNWMSDRLPKGQKYSRGSSQQRERFFEPTILTG